MRVGGVAKRSYKGRKMVTTRRDTCLCWFGFVWHWFYV